MKDLEMQRYLIVFFDRVTKGKITNLEGLFDHINRNTNFGKGFYNFFEKMYEDVKGR
ncbi:MAG: hypothetical protein KKF48_00235 [Nanoarchaeota archaeon]|nr:hypothetical protein [Nanoarchaeota archaeon]MBU1027452.1 hypothetical protein [Nanoarchaeota archaeon]